MKILLFGIQDPRSGGAASLEMSLISSIKEELSLPNDVILEFERETVSALSKFLIWIDIIIASLVWVNKSMFTYKVLGKLFGTYTSLFERRLQRKQIRFVIFFGVFERAILLRRIPFAVSLWDLGHREFHWYPEYSNNFYFENRESQLRIVLPKARYIFVSSKNLKDRLNKLYGIDSDKFRVVCFFSRKPNSLELEGNFSKIPELIKSDLVNDQFVFYPANFWKHKNHEVLIRALNNLKREGAPYRKLILTGSDKGNLSSILRLIEFHELERDVICLGFVSRIDLQYLMENASWLAMPTLLGPTNLPPLEALLAGTPCAVTKSCSEQFPNWPFVHSLDAFDSSQWLSIFDLSSTPPKVNVEIVKNYNYANERGFLNMIENIVTDISLFEGIT